MKRKNDSLCLYMQNDKSAIYIISGNFGNCHLYKKLKVIMNQ